MWCQHPGETLVQNKLSSALAEIQTVILLSNEEHNIFLLMDTF